MSTRQTPYARAFIPWIAEWHASGLSGTQERVMLLLVSRMGRDSNGWWTSVFPRSEMCSVLGISDKTAKDAVRKLKEKGLISPVGKSHNGTAQRYRIMPRSEGVAYDGPQKNKGVAETVRKGWPERYERGTSTATPLRSKKKAAPRSYGREGGII